MVKWEWIRKAMNRDDVKWNLAKKERKKLRQMKLIRDVYKMRCKK